MGTSVDYHKFQLNYSLPFSRFEHDYLVYWSVTDVVVYVLLFSFHSRSSFRFIFVTLLVSSSSPFPGFAKIFTVTTRGCHLSVPFFSSVFGSTTGGDVGSVGRDGPVCRCRPSIPSLTSTHGRKDTVTPL